MTVIDQEILEGQDDDELFSLDLQSFGDTSRWRCRGVEKRHRR
jgi:hypothetical protein